ncbi:hypothetical protein AVEN_212536-1 [Araneus ventricosus]|uniref:P-type domain-containing protein n=1 Tax=Araneus ventricosus TaxID=182803 RepID=A0A4Y2LC96_ARAVE|nr:hypothetical protein AVEN_37334-1 [Araneus ventricosus]GBN12361.1 hypothetical protein AVEN_212536-1 [Araneus ventricosus]
MDKGNYSSFMTDEKPYTSRKRKICYICAVVLVGTGLGTLLFWLINGESFKGHDKSENIPDLICSSVPDAEKFDCHPDRPVSKAECLKRGCCYTPASDLTVRDLDLINSSYLGVPSCFFSNNYKGYEVGNITKDADHIEALLNRTIPSGFRNDIQNVRLNITFIDGASLRIRVNIKIIHSLMARISNPS